MADLTIDPDKFIELSVQLVGVNRNILARDRDPIGVVNDYRETVAAAIGSDGVKRLNEKLKDFPQPTTVEAVLADAWSGPIARSILKLWLLGAWYAPQAPETLVKVVSSQAYKESLVWKAMQSHPMGYSMFAFGYWSKDPPPLEAFLAFEPTKGA